jgi:hypothetical protein
MPVERILAGALDRQPRQTVHPAPKVRRTNTQVNPDRRRERQHGRSPFPSSARTSRATQAASAPAAVRTTQPPDVTISTPPGRKAGGDATANSENNKGRAGFASLLAAGRLSETNRRFQ